MEGVGISVQAIQDTNQRLDVLIEILRPRRIPFCHPGTHAACWGSAACRGWLRGRPRPHAEGRMADELERYRLRLEQLRHLLPTLHAQFSPSAHASKPKKPPRSTTVWARSAQGQSR